MRTLQSRPDVVKTIHLAKRRTLVVTDECETATAVIFRPAAIVPGSTGANCTREMIVWPTKTTVATTGYL